MRWEISCTKLFENFELLNYGSFGVGNVDILKSWNFEMLTSWESENLQIGQLLKTENLNFEYFEMEIGNLKIWSFKIFEALKLSHIAT